MRRAALLAASFFAGGASAARPVDRYSASWATPPTAASPRSVPVGRPSPPDGPYAGNGDVTVMLTFNATSPRAVLDWGASLHLSKYVPVIYFCAY